MLGFAIERAAHGCEGFSERKDLPADQEVVVLGSHRMPKNAFRGNRHFRNQIRPCQGDALRGGASQGNSPDYPVLLVEMMCIEEAAELLGLCVSRHRRCQPYTESFGAGPLDSLPGACPCPLSTMALVALRRRAVEADLKGYALARQRAQCFELLSGKQHAVGKDRGRRGRSARDKDLADIRQHERLTASHKDFTHAKLRGLDSDPSHPLDTKRASRSFGRRAHATIIAAQIAVEVGVKP